MTDVSPRLNSPDRPGRLSAEDRERLSAAASGLKRAIDDLAEMLASGGMIQRDDARDRFEMALAEFSGVIDQSAE